MGKGSFTSLHAGISLLAGIASITGAVYSAVELIKPHPGEVHAVVRSGKDDRPLPGSTVEVLTPEDSLVDTFVTDGDGSARRPLRAGAYRLRVTAARFAPQTRDVRIERGSAAEVRFQLARQDDEAPRRSSALAHPVSRGVGAAGRFLHRLGL